MEESPGGFYELWDEMLPVEAKKVIAAWGLGRALLGEVLCATAIERAPD